MPDSQGYPTKQELFDALKGEPYRAHVLKIVACAGIVKVWAHPDIGFEGAAAVQRILAARPGVQTVNVVPNEG